jgi:glyoxylase-like metal-dependent hydrolase (beta-lactamase superfamily II)
MSIPVGSLTKIADGVECIRLPYPSRLGHINSYLLDRSILIDAGLNTPDTKAVWDDILSNELTGWRPDYLILSHFHPDHVGLGQYLSKRFDVTITMPQIEWVTGRMLFLDDSDQRVDQAKSFYLRHGVPIEIAENLSENRFRQLVDDYPVVMKPMPDQINNWTTRIARGHSPAQAVLVDQDRDICFIGDHVLPRITPNISVYPNGPTDNPLKRYLNSLDDFKGLDDETLILPSHGDPFRKLNNRIDKITTHHQSRNNRVVEICNTTKTAYEVTVELFDRDLAGWSWYFAIGEAVAHLNYLIADGRISVISDDGITRFKTRN